MKLTQHTDVETRLIMIEIKNIRTVKRSTNTDKQNIGKNDIFFQSLEKILTVFSKIL